MKNPIYFDHAAATPVDESVIRAMSPYWTDNFFNPSALYRGGVEAKQNLNSIRREIAMCVGAKPGEIVLTGGGTEANNLGIKGVMDLHGGTNLITSAIEHESVLKPAANYPHKLAPVDGQGLVDYETLSKLISDKTVLISIQYANNETGATQNLKNISRLVSQVRRERLKKGIKTSLYLHTDACQAPSYLDINPSRLGVDLMTINGGKIYGPKGSGFLFVKAGVALKPLIEGGGQEHGLRSGTENLAAAAGLAAALKLASNLRRGEMARLEKLSQELISGVVDKIPVAKLNSPLKNRLPNIVNFSFEGHDNERLIYLLDAAGLACSTGSACSASNADPSHVLSAMGFEPARIRSSLRFSLGRLTSEQDIKKATQILVDCLR